jgi:hypothetical protein
MYRKDTRKFIKPKYKITQDDVNLTFLKLLGTKQLDKITVDNSRYYEKLIVSTLFDPNVLKTYTNSLEESNYPVTSGLINIIKQNYYVNGKIPGQIYFVEPGDYYLNIDRNENNLVFQEFSIFNDGQIYENVLDMTGCFYLIHPFENYLKRNILNNIIESFGKERSYIDPINFKFILYNLQSNSLLVDANKYLYNPLSIVNYSTQFVKTELGEKVCGLEFTVSDAITLIVASAMGCLTEVYEIKVFVEVVGSISSIASSNISWDIFYNTYGNVKSDLIFSYNIIKSIRKNFPDLYVFNIFTPQFESILKSNYLIIIEQFKKLSSKSKEPPVNYDVNLWNKLSKLKFQGKIESEFESVLKIDKSSLFILLDNIDKNKDKIKKWANKNLLNGELVIGFLLKLSEYYLTKTIYSNPVLEWAKDFNSNFTKYLSHYTLEEKIMRAFIYGKQNQFSFRLDNGFYKTLINYDIFRCDIGKNKSFSSDTLVNLENNFYFYYSYQEDERISMEIGKSSIKASWISLIEPEWLIPVFPLYFSPTFNDVTMNIKDDGNVFIEFIKSQTMVKIGKKITNSWNQNYIVWDSDKTPILRDFYRSVSKIISVK